MGKVLNYSMITGDEEPEVKSFQEIQKELVDYLYDNLPYSFEFTENHRSSGTPYYSFSINGNVRVPIYGETFKLCGIDVDDYRIQFGFFKTGFIVNMNMEYDVGEWEFVKTRYNGKPIKTKGKLAGDMYHITSNIGFARLLSDISIFLNLDDKFYDYHMFYREDVNILMKKGVKRLDSMLKGRFTLAEEETTSRNIKEVTFRPTEDEGKKVYKYGSLDVKVEKIDLYLNKQALTLSVHFDEMVALNYMECAYDSLCLLWQKSQYDTKPKGMFTDVNFARLLADLTKCVFPYSECTDINWYLAPGVKINESLNEDYLYTPETEYSVSMKDVPEDVRKCFNDVLLCALEADRSVAVEPIGYMTKDECGYDVEFGSWVNLPVFINGDIGSGRGTSICGFSITYVNGNTIRLGFRLDNDMYIMYDAKNDDLYIFDGSRRLAAVMTFSEDSSILISSIITAINSNSVYNKDSISSGRVYLTESALDYSMVVDGDDEAEISMQEKVKDVADVMANRLPYKDIIYNDRYFVIVLDIGDFYSNGIHYNECRISLIINQPYVGAEKLQYGITFKGDQTYSIHYIQQYDVWCRSYEYEAGKVWSTENMELAKFVEEMTHIVYPDSTIHWKELYREELYR